MKKFAVSQIKTKRIRREKTIMKRVIAIILMIVILLGATAFPASAASYATGVYLVAANSGVNVRNGAGTNYVRVGAARNGVTFTVSRTSGNWGYTSSIQCTNGVKSGWVYLPNCRYKGNSSRNTYNDVFASTKGKGYSWSQGLSAQANTFEKGTWVYVWGLVHDIDYNLYTSYGSGTCNMTLSIFRPDGSCAHSYSYSNSDNNWIGIRLTQTGTWKIQSKITGSLSGTNTQIITVYEKNQGITFKDTSDAPRSGAFVRIRYAANGRYLDVPSDAINRNGTQLQIWDSASQNTNQYFQLIDTGKGWQLISLSSGKVIEVRDSSHNDCAQVAQWDKHSSACARWDIISNSDGTVSFRNRESGKYLNVCGGGNAGNGTKMIQYHDDGSVAMRFYIKNATLDGYQTDTLPISSSSIRKEQDLTVSSWYPLQGLSKTMIETAESPEALVEGVPVWLEAINFVLSWVQNMREVTHIHVTQGNNKKMTIQYGTPIELNVSGKKISLSELLVNRYYDFSPTIIFTSRKQADECIRSWFGLTGSGKYSMELTFGNVGIGNYGYYLLIYDGMLYQVPIIHEKSTYIVYQTKNGKTTALFDAAPILRSAKIQMGSDAAAIVMRQLVKNGYIK